MSRRANASVVVVLLLGGLALPTIAGADSGGASLASSRESGSSATDVQPGDLTTTASTGGITLSAKVSTLLRHQLLLSGSISAAGTGATVLVQRLERAVGWVSTARATVTRSGTFSTVWRTNHIGRFALRVIVLGPGRGPTSSTVAVGPAMIHVTVFRPAIATTYGQGFFGQRTACGEMLTPHTLGVAHRSLPCGTRVALYWHGRTIIVPVIDRGPYANHADWDMTGATAHALGIGGTETIGAVSLAATH